MLKLLYKIGYLLNNELKNHLIFWLVFVLYEMVFAISYTGVYKPLLHYLLFYFLNIALFYSHARLVLKNAIQNSLSDIWRIPIFILLELIIYVILTALIVMFLNFIYHGLIPMPIPFSKIFVSTVWRAVYFMLFGTGYYILQRFFEKQRKTLTQAIENEQLKNQVLRAEQAFLRAQINPHLLFNTLSFIKYAAKKKPLEADDAVMRLSSIMGFALDNNSETILLTKEMEQVENIIQLNQLRFNHALHIEFTRMIENDQAMIIPIVLLTLVENVFKHGNVMDEDNPAQIHVTATADIITLHTTNLPNQSKNIHSTKTGLPNIASRLNQAYKENYSFNYGLVGDLFKVDIKINLQNN
jgi:two-component system LytT family sensor kinase